MKIEPMEIEQECYFDLIIDVSGAMSIDITQGENLIIIERHKIQELIGVLKHEVI